MFSSGDIIALTAVVGGFLLLFVPIVALVTRKLVRDVVSALADRRGSGALSGAPGPDGADLGRLEARLGELEGEVEALKAELSFDRRLRPPPGDD